MTLPSATAATTVASTTPGTFAVKVGFGLGLAVVLILTSVASQSFAQQRYSNALPDSIVGRGEVEVAQQERLVAKLRKRLEAAGQCHVGNPRRRSAAFAILPSPEDDNVDPSPRTAELVSEFKDVCLAANAGGDRFKTPVTRPRGTMPQGYTDLGADTAFLVLDLCKMGHQPKDATILHASHGEVGTVTTVLYGNRCMKRSGGAGVGKKSKLGAWHVLEGWFNVSMRPAGLRKRAVFIEDHGKGGVCGQRILRRPHKEVFRWLRTSKQADAFRKDFLEYFGVTEELRERPRVVLLRRGIERHFQEDVVNELLSKELRNASVRYVQFDNDANPSGTGAKAERIHGYVEQLRLLASTDVLIAAHGAALSSMVALPPGAVVVELFPHNFRYHMYAELASLLRLAYYPIESLEPWGPKGPGCSGCHAVPMPTVTQPYHSNGIKKCKDCTPQCKKCDIKLDWDEHWVPMLRSALYSVRHSAAGSFWRQIKKKPPANDDETDDWAILEDT